VVRRYPENNV